jgi:hypothetical protein
MNPLPFEEWSLILLTGGQRPAVRFFSDGLILHRASPNFGRFPTAPKRHHQIARRSENESEQLHTAEIFMTQVAYCADPDAALFCGLFAIRRLDVPCDHDIASRPKGAP